MQVHSSLKAFGCVFILSTALFGCVQVPTSPDIAPIRRISAEPACTSFYASNLSTVAMGSIAVIGSGAQQSMTVGGTGSLDSATVCFTPTAVLVGSTACTYPNTTTVALPTGSVTVAWTGTYAIAVKDLDEQS